MSAKQIKCGVGTILVGATASLIWGCGTAPERVAAVQADQGATIRLFDQESLLENPWSLEWRSDTSAMIGLPKEYANAVRDYFDSAMKLVEERGVIPKRVHYQLPPTSNLPHVKSDEYPIIVDIIGRYESPIPLVILPEPAVIRSLFSPVSLDELGKAEPVWNLPPDLDVAVFFVARPDCGSWGLLLPTPHGFPGFRAGSHQGTMGWQRTMGRATFAWFYKEFAQFPELFTFKDEATFNGAVASTTVVPGNSVLRWAYLKEMDQEALQIWLAYAVVDANGAYTGTVPYGPKGYTTDNFLRPLEAPFEPTLKVTAGLEYKLPEAPVEHSLLRLPTPQDVLVPEVVPDLSEDWTLTETFYAEDPVPAWALWADKDSQPYREHFYLKHALEPSDHTLWKVVVFSNIEPSDLVRVLARMKGIPPDELPLGQEIESLLEPKYRALRKIVDSYTTPEAS
jgi:hypothetical protein